MLTIQSSIRAKPAAASGANTRAHVPKGMKHPYMSLTVVRANPHRNGNEGPSCGHEVDRRNTSRRSSAEVDQATMSLPPATATARLPPAMRGEIQSADHAKVAVAVMAVAAANASIHQRTLRASRPKRFTIREVRYMSTADRGRDAGSVTVPLPRATASCYPSNVELNCKGPVTAATPRSAGRG